MKERQFHVHPGDHSDPICSAGFDGIVMGQQNVRVDDNGVARCGICGCALELWEQRKVASESSAK